MRKRSGRRAVLDYIIHRLKRNEVPSAAAPVNAPPAIEETPPPVPVPAVVTPAPTRTPPRRKKSRRRTFKPPCCCCARCGGSHASVRSHGRTGQCTDCGKLCLCKKSHRRKKYPQTSKPPVHRIECPKHRVIVCSASKPQPRLSRSRAMLSRHHRTQSDRMRPVSMSPVLAPCAKSIPHNPDAPQLLDKHQLSINSSFLLRVSPFC